MWSLKVRNDGTLYLTFDRERRYTNSLRGVWVLVGPQAVSYTAHAVRINENAGLFCVDDDEGGVRCLVLE